MNTRKLILAIVFLLSGFTLKAQEKWTLQKCIDQAIMANLGIKNSELTLQSTETDVLQAKAAVLPSLNGNASHTYSWGRAVDPNTNLIATSRVQSNSFGASSNVVLFNGLQTLNNIRVNELALKASQADLAKMKNDIQLTVASSYLAILLNMEAVDNARGQVEISRQQLDRMEKLVGVGQVARGDMLNAQSQLASDELTLVNAENTLALSYLDLIQAMMLTPEQAEGFAIEKPSIEAEDIALVITPKEIYNVAEGTMPEIKAAELRIEQAGKNLAWAKGGQSPTLSLGANFGAQYSDFRTQISDFTIDGVDTIGFTDISQEAVVTPSFSYNTEPIPFWDQLKDNNTSVGFNLSVPIFNGLRVRTNIQKAKIGIAQAQVSLDQVKNDLRTNINRAYADAKAARNSFLASQSAVEAAEESFKYQRLRYEQNMINSVDFNLSKNQLAIAQANLTRSKFEFIFRTKILDFYQGKPLSL